MFYDDLTTHRQRAGLRIAALARAASVGETTIRRIEKHEASTVETLNLVINALNSTPYYAAKPLSSEKVLTVKSKYGTTTPTKK